MKNLLKITLLLATITVAGAVHAADESWTCYAQGKQSFGPPVGDIWQTVLGRGATELDATDDAQQNCHSQGLQSCMVESCFKD